MTLKNLCQGRREIEILESVRNQSERRNLHVYLEQKAELASRGEEAAQKILSKAEADMEIRNWEKRNSDIALYETKQELESQRLQLQTGESMG